ncbi:hypothetical protein C0Q70_11837 [Pomacea canaliculata]|uniref:G-protein coupled receptors family 1 profile domain-containing protein n=1 Tax=Pomacea canaliculata TaxID=400727 RepID=A0A2T7P737_POMCA|nr:hypothetical protein C0Q70_11837 [Pomacea canaliculata]
MEYIESEDCNKSLSDIVNCSLPYEQGSEFSPLKPEAVAVPFTFALIFLLGVSGNTLLILNFARHKKLNTAHNALVVKPGRRRPSDADHRRAFQLHVVHPPLLALRSPRLQAQPFRGNPGNSGHHSNLGRAERGALPDRHGPPPLSLAIVPRAARRRGGDVGRGFRLGAPRPDVRDGSERRQPDQHDLDGGILPRFQPSWGSDYPKTNVLCRFLLLFVVPLLVIGPCYAALAYHLFFRMYRTRDTPTSKTPLKSAAISMATRGSSVRTGSPALLRMSSFADDGPGQVHDDDVVVGANDNEADASCLQNNSSNCSKSIKNSNSNNNTPALKRQRLALTVLALVIAFIVCWLPRHIYLLWFHFDPSQFSYFWHVFKISGFCLMFSNSAVNPFVFYVVDDHFRTHVHETLLCRRRVRGRDDGEDATTRGRDLAAADDTAADDKNTYIPMSEMPTCTERLEYV